MADTGIKVWAADGTLLLDGTKRTGRIKGSVYLTGTAGAVSADLSGGDPIYSFQPDQLYYHISNDTPPPQITATATGVSWSYSGAQSSFSKPITGWLFFGVK